MAKRRSPRKSRNAIARRDGKKKHCSHLQPSAARARERERIEEGSSLKGKLSLAPTRDAVRRLIFRSSRTHAKTDVWNWNKGREEKRGMEPKKSLLKTGNGSRDLKERHPFEDEVDLRKGMAN